MRYTLHSQLASSFHSLIFRCHFRIWAHPLISIAYLKWEHWNHGLHAKKASLCMRSNGLPVLFFLFSSKGNRCLPIIQVPHCLFNFFVHYKSLLFDYKALLSLFYFTNREYVIQQFFSSMYRSILTIHLSNNLLPKSVLVELLQL